MKDLKKQFIEKHKQERQNKSSFSCSYANKEFVDSLNIEKLSVSLTDLENTRQIVIEDYIPAPSKPLTFICINIHVFQDSNGRGSFKKEDIKRLKEIFHYVNHRFTFNFPANYNPNYAPKPHLQQGIDSRIRFVINRIEFYQDDNLCRSLSDGPMLAEIRNRDASMMNQLNFLINNPIPSPSYTGHAVFPTSNLLQDQYVRLMGSRNTAGIPELHASYGDWFLSLHWCHELGHILGLCHTYGQSRPTSLCANCDETHPLYIYDVHGLSPNQICPIPQSASNNNVMAGAQTEAFSTIQIAKMHYALENLTVGKYAKGCCCTKCVAFGASIHRHKSQGAPVTLSYEKTLANRPWAWDGKLFTCPTDGIYNFSISYQKDALIDGGTSKDVWVKLWADWDLLGTAWSEQTDAKTRGLSNNPQSGRRDSVGFATNVRLKKGTVVKTEIGTFNNEKRHVVDVNFSGHLLCSDCC